MTALIQQGLQIVQKKGRTIISHVVAGTIVMLAMLIMLFPQMMMAQGPVNSTPSSAIGKFENPLKVGSIEDLIFALVAIALQIGVVVAALALIWVGFRYVAARGNPEKVKDAHQALLYTIIGIAILFGAKVIVAIIQSTIEPLAPNLFTTLKK